MHEFTKSVIHPPRSDVRWGNGGAVSWLSPSLQGSIIVGYKTGIKERLGNPENPTSLTYLAPEATITQPHRDLVNDAFYGATNLSCKTTGNGIDITIDGDTLQLVDDDVKQLVNMLIMAVKGELKIEYPPIVRLSTDRNYTYIIDVERYKNTGTTGKMDSSYYYEFVLLKSGNKPADKGKLLAFKAQEIKDKLGKTTSERKLSDVALLDLVRNLQQTDLPGMKWQYMIDSFDRIRNEKSLPEVTDRGLYIRREYALGEVMNSIIIMQNAYKYTVTDDAKIQKEFFEKNFIPGYRESRDVGQDYGKPQFSQITVTPDQLRQLFNLIVDDKPETVFSMDAPRKTRRYTFHWNGRQFEVSYGIVGEGIDPEAK